MLYPLSYGGVATAYSTIAKCGILEVFQFPSRRARLLRFGSDVRGKPAPVGLSAGLGRPRRPDGRVVPKHLPLGLLPSCHRGNASLGVDEIGGHDGGVVLHERRRPFFS